MKYELGFYFPDDETHFQPYLENGGYQILQREMGIAVCRALNLPMRTALDIGAHVGLWAKPLSDIFQTTICFEPRPENVVCLTKNLHGANCVIHPVGLSDHDAQLQFHIPNKIHNSGAGSLTQLGVSVDTITVDVKTLDSFELREIDFIKMDIQGWEAHALRGAEKTLRENQPVILCENHPEQAVLMDIFSALGYERIVRVVKEDIYVPRSLLTPETRHAIMLYFNERKAYFEGLA